MASLRIPSFQEVDEEEEKVRTRHSLRPKMTGATVSATRATPVTTTTASTSTSTSTSTTTTTTITNVQQPPLPSTSGHVNERVAESVRNTRGGRGGKEAEGEVHESLLPPQESTSTSWSNLSSGASSSFPTGQDTRGGGEGGASFYSRLDSQPSLPLSSSSSSSSMSSAGLPPSFSSPSSSSSMSSAGWNSDERGSMDRHTSFSSAFGGLRDNALYVPPAPPLVQSAQIGTGRNIIVNENQRKNPLLQHIRNVPYEFANIVPDFICGPQTGVLFLSIKFHLRSPEYIFDRVKALGPRHTCRVLLVHVDIEDNQDPILSLTKLALTQRLTLILAWSLNEAGRYIETYKAYESKPPDAIRGRVEEDPLSRLTDAFTTVRSVTKSDVVSLTNSFESLQDLAHARIEEFALVPGFGPSKVRNLYDMFNAPFLIKSTKAGSGKGGSSDGMSGGSGGGSGGSSTSAVVAAALGTAKVFDSDEEEGW